MFIRHRIPLFILVCPLNSKEPFRLLFCFLSGVFLRLVMLHFLK